MSENPYEAPQTLGEPLPMATEAYPFVRTREGLIRAAAQCCEGGRFQFAAGLIGILAVLLAFQRHDPNGPEFLEKLLFLGTSASTVVLWIWGAVKNFRGYSGMAKYVTDDAQGNLYTMNQMQWWFQVALVILLCFTFPGPHASSELIFAFLALLLLVCYLHAVLLQVYALRNWYARFETPSLANGYFAGGIAVAICLGAELVLPLFGKYDEGALHVALSLLLALTAWDYAQRYQALREALLEQGNT